MGESMVMYILAMKASLPQTIQKLAISSVNIA